MRSILTETEIGLSAQIQKVLTGATFDEAFHALEHASGCIKAALHFASTDLVFHPTDAESP